MLLFFKLENFSMGLVSHTGNGVVCSSSKKPVPSFLPAAGSAQHHLCAKDTSVLSWSRHPESNTWSVAHKGAGIWFQQAEEKDKPVTAITEKSTV